MAITYDTPDFEYRHAFFLGTKRIDVPNPQHYSWERTSFIANACYAAGKESYEELLARMPSSARHWYTNALNPALYLQFTENKTLMSYLQQKDKFTPPDEWTLGVQKIIGHLQVSPRDYASRSKEDLSHVTYTNFPCYMLECYANGFPLWVLAEQHDMTEDQIESLMTYAAIKIADTTSFVLWASIDESVKLPKGPSERKAEEADWFGYKHGARIQKDRKLKSLAGEYLSKREKNDER